MNTLSLVQVPTSNETEAHSPTKGSADEFRATCRETRAMLADVVKSVKAIDEFLASPKAADDATFVVRDELVKLSDSLDDVNIKKVIKDLLKVTRNRLIARASE